MMWLAPRLEAQGYKVFADIRSLETGDRWRREITQTLQDKAVKMLLCCRDATLGKQGVQEEIGIAEDLLKSLRDPRFIMPLRLAPFKKVFGIGELQYTNFENRWADGLAELLDDLESQNVPRGQAAISPNWENYRKRRGVKIEDRPETLISNWLRVAALPEALGYFQPTGAINHQVLYQACRDARLPAEPYLRGFFSFCTLDEVNREYSGIGKFEVRAQISLAEFLENGFADLAIRSGEARKLIMSMLRRAWEQWCLERGLLRYEWSSLSGFHVTDKQIALGKKVAWGTQGEGKRLSVLRNIAQKKIWQYGVSATPALWPFPHFKLKARVLFSQAEDVKATRAATDRTQGLFQEGVLSKAGDVIDDKDTQHRARRSVCKGWRNKQWHGRLRAFIELLTGDSPIIHLALGDKARARLDAMPMFFTSPVATVLPDDLADEDEEVDDQTLAGSSPPTKGEED